MSESLVIIDMQRYVELRIQQGVGYYPVNAVQNSRQVLAHFRRHGLPVIHVHHQSSPEDSLLHPTSPAFPVMSELAGLPGEPLFIKTTSSAFTSTELQHYLNEHGITTLTVIGAVCGFCINTTVRDGADLGFTMKVVSDAVISFDVPDNALEAKNIHQVTLGLLAADFAKIINTQALADAASTR